MAYEISCGKVLRKVFAKEALADGASNNILSNVPDTRQSANYSCGATALQAVLKYWGIDIEEDKLISYSTRARLWHE